MKVDMKCELELNLRGFKALTFGVDSCNVT